MKTLNFPKYKVFFYSTCTEDKMTEAISDAEEEGCSLVQVMAGMMPAPRSPLALPGERPQMIHIMRILVRAPEKMYNDIIAKAQKAVGAN